MNIIIILIVLLRSDSDKPRGTSTRLFLLGGTVLVKVLSSREIGLLLSSDVLLDS